MAFQRINKQYSKQKKLEVLVKNGDTVSQRTKEGTSTLFSQNCTSHSVCIISQLTEGQGEL